MMKRDPLLYIGHCSWGSQHPDPEGAIRALLIGRRVAKVADDRLHLDDGTELTIVGNDGCGGCAMGWYHITELNECLVNAITAVEFEDDHETFRLFVLAEDQRIKLLQIEGQDNGYYGTGYWVEVQRP